MKSILENRSALAKEVDKVAEVAGYLWQKSGQSVSHCLISKAVIFTVKEPTNVCVI